MYLFNYRQNPRMFWLTLTALFVVVIVLWPQSPRCSQTHGQTWDYQTNTPLDCH